MSEQLERFASCEQITEWVKPNDTRFINTFGQVPKANWQRLRQSWEVNWSTWFRDRSVYRKWIDPVQRLLVPMALHDTVKVQLGVDGPSHAYMAIDFENTDNWAQCMPVDESTNVMNSESKLDGLTKFHMAVALCGKTAGLTVIAMEFKNEELWGVDQDFSIHPVDDAALGKLIAARDF